MTEEVKRLRMAIEVWAGVIPGQPIEEYTKRFLYSEDDYAADKTLVENTPGDEPVDSKYRQLMKEAHDYAISLSDPSVINWVRTEFIWL